MSNTAKLGAHNPIEIAFAKLKAFLRAAHPRTYEQVCQLIAAALELFTRRNAPTTLGTPLSRSCVVMGNALSLEAFEAKRGDMEETKEANEQKSKSENEIVR